MEIRIETNGKAVKRRKPGCAITWVVLVALFVVLMNVLAPFTQYLWFLHDARQPRVFTLQYTVRGMLFLPSFLFAWAFLYFNLRQAFNLSLVFLSTPGSLGQALASSAVRWIRDNGAGFVKFVSPVIAFFYALVFSGNWNAFLLAQNPQSFGVKDPILGHDLSFYVFSLPWYRTITSSVFSLLLLTTVLALGLYIGMQAIAMMARIELGRPHVRFHISLLAGLTIAAFGVQFGLGIYEYGYRTGAQFTGAGYAASTAINFHWIVAGLLILVGLVTILMSKSEQPYRVTGLGLALSFVLGVVGLGIVPAVIQRISVEPDKLNKEGPYAKRAIEMTRFAYGLDKIEARDFDVQDVPTPADVQASQATLDNMRLWDPGVVRQSIEALQSLRQYYTFRDVDVDRYMIDGQQRMVMISPRDIDLGGLSANAQTWVNTRLRYTHGFGVTMSLVNDATPQGQPTFIVRDIPTKTSGGIRLDQPRIYYTDDRQDGGYMLVNTKVSEFDYPSENDDRTYRWTSTRGIPVGSLLTRVAFSIMLGDGNLLVSGNITPNSRLLLHRGVLERSQRIYPFLQFDRDPYIVVHNGRLVWILDGYTTTDRIPYSERTFAGLNYIRNSVKVVIDAYSGETTAYAVEPNEPILRAYRKIYPGLIQDVDRLPTSLRAHFRYPEDMFRVQTSVLTQYHVTDPTTFLSNGDAWEIPFNRGSGGDRAPIEPYYVQMKLPGEARDSFLLIMPFTPARKTNMSGWLAAHCDPDQYGKLTLYRFPKDTNIPGPEQVEANFLQNPAVAQANLQFNQSQSRIIVGNLLVVPIGNSVMYVEPLFLRSNVSGSITIPELRKVILGVKGRIAVGDTYADALRQLFEGIVSAPEATAEPETGSSAPQGTTPAPPTTRERRIAREALQLYREADAALRRGDLGAYGEVQKRIRAKLEELAR